MFQLLSRAVLLWCVCHPCVIVLSEALLYPRESVSRDLRSLDGVWSFRISPKDDVDFGFRRKWFRERLSLSGNVTDMPVPSSFNDITADKTVRDFVGWVWYDRSFFVPHRWWNKRVVLRFGSVNHYARVFVNGNRVQHNGEHEGGHLPFEMEIQDYVKFGSRSNFLTVAVNNTLNPSTIPQGYFEYKNDSKMYPPGFFEQKFKFTYFHYAGIHRSVFLYTTPLNNSIKDVIITSNFSRSTTDVTAYVTFKAYPRISSETAQNVKCHLAVTDKHDRKVDISVVFSQKSPSHCGGVITLENATLWWPLGMGTPPGFMYNLELLMRFESTSTDTSFIDNYVQPFGVRYVEWDKDKIYVNSKPLYLHGFGKHEDADIVGRGLHLPLMVRDINLLKWTGANVFRTSHYPYAEELMDMTDSAGILVIVESPAINLEGFTETLLNKHLRVMRDMVSRDKNHPSVFMWSLGNEPSSSVKAAGPYFAEVYRYTREMDPTRPITTVLSHPAHGDQVAAHMDVILINRYYSWYSDPGRTEIIQQQVIYEMNQWRQLFHKPVAMSEYGAGSVVGLRDLPEFIWTEDYQVVFLEQFMKSFDRLRQNSWFLGEMVWNFADFLVPADYVRPQFCMKGVFTRNRKPKLAAYIVRQRYKKLIDLD